MSEAQPRIELVKEGQEPREVKVLLDDIQDTMGVAWPPANWRAYAMYPGVMRLFWQRLRPAVSTEQYLRESLKITEKAYRDASRWYEPSPRVRLSRENAPRVQWELDSFEYGNPQVLIQQAALDRALRDEKVGHEGDREPRHLPSRYRWPEIKMIQDEEASEEVRSLFQEIKGTLGLPLVNSDYRGLAKWPEFLRPAWDDVRRWRNRPEYLRLAHQLEEMGDAAARNLPVPITLSREEILDAIGEEGEMENLRQMVSLFTRLLPALIVNDALFRIAAVQGQPPVTPAARVEALPSLEETFQQRAETGALGTLSRLARPAAAVVVGLLAVAALGYAFRSMGGAGEFDLDLLT